VSFIKSDKLKIILVGINDLVRKKVLVGFPESTDARQDDDNGSPMNNATLAYIHENGSPAANIPARPFLVPGVEDSLSKVEGALKKAAQNTLDRKTGAVDANLNQAGIVASMSVKNKINDGDFAPLKPSTVSNRRNSRDTKSMRKSEKEYMELIASGAQAAGMSLSEIESASGVKPLVNTAQMRNAVTYVIRD
jgi:hypothetical protein